MDYKALLFIAFALLLWYGFNRFIYRKRRYLSKKGILGKATIISIEKTGINYGDDWFEQPLMEVVLEIEATEKRQVVIRQAFEKSEIPKLGDKVYILIDPANADNVMIDS